jgi:hypothetical protein
VAMLRALRCDGHVPAARSADTACRVAGNTPFDAAELAADAERSGNHGACDVDLGAAGPDSGEALLCLRTRADADPLPGHEARGGGAAARMSRLAVRVSGARWRERAFRKPVPAPLPLTGGLEPRPEKTEIFRSSSTQRPGRPPGSPRLRRSLSRPRGLPRTRMPASAGRNTTLPPAARRFQGPGRARNGGHEVLKGERDIFRLPKAA